MAKRWNRDEEQAWRDYLAGYGDRPSNRTDGAVRARIGAPEIPREMTAAQRHAASMAAFSFIKFIPYTGDGSHGPFVEAVIEAARNDWNLARLEWDALTVDAVKAAGEAAYATQAA